MLQRSDIKPVILPILAVFMLAFFAVYFLGGYDQAEAQSKWVGPPQGFPPPQENTEAPLRTDTQFRGHVTGTYDKLTLNGDASGLNCTSSDSIIWDGNEFICGVSASNSGLLNILNNNSDASEFIGGVYLGELTSTSSTWLDLGGSLTAKWLHATSTFGQSVIAHDLAVRGSILTSQDISFANGKSLRIDRSGTTTALYIGNYADGLGFDRSSGDKADLFVEGIVDASSLCVNGDCVNNFNNLGGAVFKQLSATASNGNVGGYGGANSKCPSGMHVCTVEEILNTINRGLMPDSIAEPAWISAGPPGYVSRSNDCNGWVNGTNYYGRVWNFPGKYGILTSCATSNKFACCQ